MQGSITTSSILYQKKFKQNDEIELVESASVSFGRPGFKPWTAKISLEMKNLSQDTHYIPQFGLHFIYVIQICMCVLLLLSKFICLSGRTLHMSAAHAEPKNLRPVLNNVSLPLGVNLALMGEHSPWGTKFTLSFTPRGKHSLKFRRKDKGHP
jgi:hypothetical protein